MAENGKTFALYARCSTRKQDLESQKEALFGWAEKHGHDTIYYEDLAISGKKDNRKGINQLMADARENKFDGVAVLEVSRIGRSIRFFYQVVEELNKYGISITLVKNNSKIDYNTLEGKALVGALALCAEIEWHLIKERNERARIAREAKGIKGGRPRRHISKESIGILRSKGWSYRKIAKELNVSLGTIFNRIQEDPELKKQVELEKAREVLRKYDKSV